MDKKRIYLLLAIISLVFIVISFIIAIRSIGWLLAIAGGLCMFKTFVWLYKNSTEETKNGNS